MKVATYDRQLLALLLFLASFVGGCKPRGDNSATLAEQGAETEGFWLERTTLDTVTKNSKDVAVTAGSVGDYTAKHPFLTVEDRVKGFQTVRQMVQVATQCGLFLTDAAKSKDALKQGAGRVYAPEAELADVLDDYDQAIKAMNRLAEKAFWANEWTAEKSKTVTEAMNIARANLLRALDQIKNWQAVEAGPAIPPAAVPFPSDLDVARDHFHAVKGLEDAVASGRFDGDVPTVLGLREALRQDMAQPPAKRMGQRLIAELSRLDAIRQLFAEDAGVSEGYTIQQHTEMVLGVYFQQLKFAKFPAGRDYSLLMPLVIALHDIGKPVAARTKDLADELRKAKAWGQDKKLDAEVQMNGSQHIHNAVVASAVLKRLGFSDAEADLAFALLNHDVLGHLAKREMSASVAYSELQRLANGAKVPVPDFYDLLRPLYVADATSYDYVRQNFFVTESSGRLTTRNGSLADVEIFVRPPPKPVQPPPRPTMSEAERKAQSKKPVPEKEMSSPWSWFTSWF